VVAALALGIGAELVTYDSGELGTAIGDLAAGWALIGCGIVAWERRPNSRVGVLLAASGIAWFLGSLWTAALYLHRGPLFHALLGYPSGRPARRSAVAVLAVVYISATIEPLGRSPVVTLVVCALVAAEALASYLAELGPRRRARAVGTAGTLVLAFTLAFGAVQRLAGWDADSAALWAYEIVVAGVALALTVDLVRARWSQGSVTGLVIDLGRLGEPAGLRDRLARALGDPSLELGFWVDSNDGYVDDAGRPFTVPAPGPTRTVTQIASEGEQLALLVHDTAVLEDPELLDDVTAAIRIAVANARLQAAVRSRVAELEASRRRIVEAEDAERRRLERELRERTEGHLDVVAAKVDALEAGVTDAHAREVASEVQVQLQAARDELGELARGIHPTELTSGGLAAALPALARNAPVPVELTVSAERLPSTVEAAIYFVCSEALTNIAKYARAQRVSIDVERSDGLLVATVSDDGVGGADARRGSGLLGLSDRVAALGGTLEISSPPGAGTTIRALLPAG
jgi:signal transduction histidine kinase